MNQKIKPRIKIKKADNELRRDGKTDRITGLAALLRSASYEVFSTTPAPASFFRSRLAFDEKEMKTKNKTDLTSSFMVS